ncbi:hypothetical protein [Vibrio parahaemolyticus]|uniref:hypothetical protein n=1 Tax=Vibrio parahaemolyticus TaxID=670 RepID=UPI001EE9F235|nr:hypothetical protein [Vibrio parahaemolyticus]MCG6437295.1 hypothetical protein [Vibrio parahaemolyticus]HCH4001839.1 hypothetical protein [Vibrio parahaemolyticus]
MPVNHILSEEAVNAHEKLLESRNYRDKAFFDELIDCICSSVTHSTLDCILVGTLNDKLVQSFGIYGGLLEDVRVNMINLWIQTDLKSDLPTVQVCGEYVPAVWPINVFDLYRNARSSQDHYWSLSYSYANWLDDLKEKEESVEMAYFENAVRSMKERLRAHVKDRLVHYYNLGSQLEAIGTPYLNNLLQVKFKSRTCGARVMYTPLYNYSPQYTNGFTSPATANMDPGTYELRIFPANGSQRIEPHPYGIHQSQTVRLTV